MQLVTADEERFDQSGIDGALARRLVERAALHYADWGLERDGFGAFRSFE